jgi:hypothetical protein
MIKKIQKLLRNTSGLKRSFKRFFENSFWHLNFSKYFKNFSLIVLDSQTGDFLNLLFRQIFEPLKAHFSKSFFLFTLNKSLIIYPNKTKGV